MGVLQCYLMKCISISLRSLLVKQKSKNNYYGIEGVSLLFKSVVYDYTTFSGFRSYDKYINAGQPRNTFFGITGSSDLNISRNSLDNLISRALNKLQIRGLSNYYDKGDSVSLCSSSFACDSLSGSKLL